MTGGTMRRATPSMDEFRAVVQPPELLARNNHEHWAGRLYMRRVSPYCTRLLLHTPLTPNGVTWLMIAAGGLAAAVLTLPGLLPAIGAVLLIQLQLLLDCSDGELARWTETRSTAGLYLDQLGHHLTSAALPIALGIRADGGWDELGGFTTLGLVVAVLVLITFAETALVTVARAEAGQPRLEDTAAVTAPRGRRARGLRRLVAYVPFFRAFVAIEASILALLAAVVDMVAGDLAGSRTLLWALVVIGVVTAAGHLYAILASSRLR